ncbi:hypothetical protein ISF_01703 [Cordyceps fumosorosea ARSEF 2679]|uniref:F-box domain-containing protein n=1 Tax=Cordyceps fumosorosea (strain ARSEF 2679) TaxID=1081104 RepID=A0A162JMP2_CORFA|nr:hypothetical protein ISF_01703 [Cordyceps fumosorosea ARSEF 2679]OAA71152.1 hypothetical protein ISF_01703 [Cordyceps fumosorosea ARSEF 2679]
MQPPPPPAAEHDGPAPMPPADITLTNFMLLPAELHLQISELLTYPDALSLKQTNRRMRLLVNTGMPLKVEWLLERRRLHLDCPNDHSCDLGSDLRFCRGSVPLLLKRRREHYECESRPGLGCLVYDTPKCANKPRDLKMYKMQLIRTSGWLRRNLPEQWWLVLVLSLLLLWI